MRSFALLFIRLHADSLLHLPDGVVGLEVLSKVDDLKDSTAAKVLRGTIGCPFFVGAVPREALGRLFTSLD